MADTEFPSMSMEQMLVKLTLNVAGLCKRLKDLESKQHAAAPQPASTASMMTSLPASSQKPSRKGKSKAHTKVSATGHPTSQSLC